MSEEVDNIQETSGGIEVFEAQQRAEYDIQIATAKRFPRNLVRVKENCVAIVTMSDEVAASCRYKLPRGGKNISGPSVHLARILAQQYGNIRVDARVKQITPDQVVSEAVCFDLETNYACKVEVRRSIISVDKESGERKRYKDDMITVTGNAGNAIALRNAILNVIPKGISQVVYDAAMRRLTNELTDSDKMKQAIKNLFDGLKDHYGVSEERVLKAIHVASRSDMTKEDVLDLKAMVQAIKDGDSTVDEQFPDSKKQTSGGKSQADKVAKTFEQTEGKSEQHKEEAPKGQNEQNAPEQKPEEKGKETEKKGKLF